MSRITARDHMTYQYTLYAYSRNKLQAQETIMQLQSQLEYLEKQSNKPRSKSKPEILKEYEMQYNTSSHAKHELMSASSHLSSKNYGVTLFQSRGNVRSSRTNSTTDIKWMSA